MKIISAALKTAIGNGTIATFIKITRQDNISYGYTDHDKEMTFDSLVYVPSPALERISMNLRNNAEVSNQEFLGTWDINLDEDDLKNGLYDDASIDVFRADWSGGTIDTVITFRGTLGIIQWTDEGFRADIHSSMQQLQKQIGMIYTSKCRHKLFEQINTTNVGACTLSDAAFTYNSSVTVNTSKIKFTAGSIGQPDDWVTNGRLLWTSGLNTGTEYTVKSFKSNVYELFLPTVFSINNTDTFTVFAGCDKTFDTCTNKFSNQINFGGFPHIKPEVNWK